MDANITKGEQKKLWESVINTFCTKLKDFSQLFFVNVVGILVYHKSHEKTKIYVWDLSNFSTYILSLQQKCDEILHLKKNYIFV